MVSRAATGLVERQRQRGPGRLVHEPHNTGEVRPPGFELFDRPQVHRLARLHRVPGRGTLLDQREPVRVDAALVADRQPPRLARPGRLDDRDRRGPQHGPELPGQDFAQVRPGPGRRQADRHAQQTATALLTRPRDPVRALQERDDRDDHRGREHRQQDPGEVVPGTDRERVVRRVEDVPEPEHREPGGHTRGQRADERADHGHDGQVDGRLAERRVSRRRTEGRRDGGGDQKSRDDVTDAAGGARRAARPEHRERHPGEGRERPARRGARRGRRTRMVWIAAGTTGASEQRRIPTIAVIPQPLIRRPGRRGRMRRRYPAPRNVPGREPVGAPSRNVGTPLTTVARYPPGRRV